MERVDGLFVPEQDIVPERARNIHHPFWTKRTWTGSIQRIVRNMTAVEMFVDWHNDLHADLPPTPLIDNVTLYGLRDFLLTRQYEPHSEDVVEWTYIYFQDRHHTEAAEHFGEQITYIRGEHGKSA